MKITYRIDCFNCKEHYIGKGGRLLYLRIGEHQLAIKRHGISSLILMHVDTHSTGKMLRVFEMHQGIFRSLVLESINEQTETDQIYQPVGKTMVKYKTKNQIN